MSSVTPDLLNQNLQLTSVLQVTHGHSSLRNTGLGTRDTVVEMQDGQCLCPHGVHGVAASVVAEPDIE